MFSVLCFFLFVCLFVFLVFVFLAGSNPAWPESHSVALAGLKLLPYPPECWGYRLELLYLVRPGLLFNNQTGRSSESLRSSEAVEIAEIISTGGLPCLVHAISFFFFF